MELDLQLMKAAQEQFMCAAVRALLLSHPNPAALRKAWMHAISLAWGNVGAAGPTPEMQAAMREIQEIWETYLPKDSG